MINREEFYGRSQVLTPSADFTLNPLAGVVVKVTPSVTLIKGLFPDARYFENPGGRIAHVYNKHASNQLRLATKNGTVFATLNAGKMAVVDLLDNTTEDGSWQALIFTVAS